MRDSSLAKMKKTLTFKIRPSFSSSSVLPLEFSLEITRESKKRRTVLSRKLLESKRRFSIQENQKKGEERERESCQLTTALLLRQVQNEFMVYELSFLLISLLISLFFSFSPKTRLKISFLFGDMTSCLTPSLISYHSSSIKITPH